MKKTAPINVIVEIETKRRLKGKAEELGLTLTAFLEKIAREEIVFLDKNTRKVLEVLNLKPNNM